MAGISDTFNQNFRVRFWQRDDPAQAITAWLGDTPPTPSAGGGGYNVIALPMRSAVSVWQGRANLLVLDIPIMLWGDDPEPAILQLPPGRKGQTGAVMTSGPQARGDTFPATTKQQADALIRMWRPDDDTQAPPVVKVAAKNSLIPYQQLSFWVSDFTWGAAIANDGAVRIMQQLTIQLTEYRDDEELQTAKAKRPGRSKRQRTYRVKAGDTLAAIAQRYHLKNGWRQLAAAQNPPINDPRSLRVGQTLTIPGQ